MRTSFSRLVAVGLTVASALPATASAKHTRSGGKLLLTNGISSVEGASGGGLTPWAVIAGNETRDGIGVSIHTTFVELKSYDFRTAGISVGIFDRVELSYARQRFDTNEIGARLGLGANYSFKQDVFGAKVKLAGDLIYGPVSLPAIAVGAQYKRNLNGAVVRAIGAGADEGVDYYISASKLFLSRSILTGVTLRATKANQLGILGFGGDKRRTYSVQIEGSVAWQLAPKLAVGGEYRTKPDNLAIATEDSWYDVFAAYTLNRHITATVAYTDLGSIATVAKQRGVLVSLQAAY